MPTGMIIAYGANTLPSGYLKCDGSAVSRSTYAALFAVIGTLWGAGDETTTFTLPDLRGRTIIGMGHGSGLTDRVIATGGGEETHQLTLPEIPDHAHNFSVAFDSAAGGGGNAVIDGNGDANLPFAGSTDGQGEDGSHNNMQPYGVCQWIIKT